MIRSEIEFKCKQFWSNEQNKITAEVFPRDGKKAILKVPQPSVAGLDPGSGARLFAEPNYTEIWPCIGEGIREGLIKFYWPLQIKEKGWAKILFSLSVGSYTHSHISSSEERDWQIAHCRLQRAVSIGSHGNTCRYMCL
jgi:hypothetical protein